LHDAVEIGREPQGAGMVIADRRGQVNIKWCSGSRAVEAQFNGFSIDRAMSGRRQAQVSFERGDLQLRSLHKQCPTYLFQEGRLKVVKEAVEVLSGNTIVIGTSVLSIEGVEL
jgi:hypothetical protein